MTRPNPNPWLILAFVAGILYPPLVYFGMGVLSPTHMVLIGLVLIGLRLFGLRHKPDAKIWQIVFCIAALGLTAMLFMDAHLAVQAYPVVVSLSVSAVFGLSLLFPPTLVERMARLTEPNLPPDGVIYTRKVTMVWTAFLLINAGISAATALWGTLAQWALWNGLLSYLFMGMLFIGELIVRRRVRR
jgi:uncharacterized membrane protein